MNVIVRKGKRDGFVELLFAEKPDAAVLEQLKSSDFRFYGPTKVWWGRETALPNAFKSLPVQAAAPVPPKVAPVAKPKVTPAPKTQVKPQPEPEPVEEPEVTAEKSGEAPRLTPDRRWDPDHPGHILIRENTGDRMAKAVLVEGGLAVNRVSKGKGYNLTHVHSGQALGRAFMELGRADAESLLRSANNITDWKLPAAELLKQADLPQRLRDLIQAHKDLANLQPAAKTEAVKPAAPAPKPAAKPNVVKADFKALTITKQEDDLAVLESFANS